MRPVFLLFVVLFLRCDARLGGLLQEKFLKKFDKSLHTHASIIKDSYDEAESLRNAYMSGIAYCSADRIVSGDNLFFEALSGVDIGNVWTNSSLQYYTAFDFTDNAVVLSIRGSDNLINWLDNIDTTKTAPYNDSSIEVHKGFYDEYKTLRDYMAADVLRMSEVYGTQAVKLTGHR